MSEPLDALRYDRLGYVALNVRDLDASAAFYEDIVGLEQAGVGPNGERLLRCSSSHHDILLAQGEAPGLKRLGWVMESEDAFGFARDHLQSLGLQVDAVAPAEAAALGFDEGFRFREPTSGAQFEFSHGMKTADTPFTPKHTKIARLGHVVLSSPDRIATETFLLDKLNFRVSDRIEGAVSFMRCFPNPYHHSFGVSQGAAASLNHVNFMVTEIDDIGKAIYRMKKNDVKVVFGPGKHPPSESVFFYFLDPDKITVEYSYGMEEFAEVDPRAAREMPRSLESIDYWGAMPDPEFGANGGIET